MAKELIWLQLDCCYIIDDAEKWLFMSIISKRSIACLCLFPKSMIATLLVMMLIYHNQFQLPFFLFISSVVMFVLVVNASLA